jgi:hypothetical protein
LHGVLSGPSRPATLNRASDADRVPSTVASFHVARIPSTRAISSVSPGRLQCPNRPFRPSPTFPLLLTLLPHNTIATTITPTSRPTLRTSRPHLHHPTNLPVNHRILRTCSAWSSDRRTRRSLSLGPPPGRLRPSFRTRPPSSSCQTCRRTRGSCSPHLPTW